MEPLGKTMKIEYNNNHSETDALKMHACTELPKYTTSCNWSDTCRCAIQGWLMHFLPKEEGIRRTNPIGPTKRQVTKARKRNRKKKSSKYLQTSNLDIDDNVLISNYSRTKKFDPIFQATPSTVTTTENDGRTITIETPDGQQLKRHPDDIKLYNSYHSPKKEETSESTIQEKDMLCKWHRIWQAPYNSDYYEAGNDDRDENYWEEAPQPIIRRSNRQRIPNRKYYNENFRPY